MKKLYIIILIAAIAIGTGFKPLAAKRLKIKKIAGVAFVYIPAGSYLMGSPKGYGYKNERPQKKIVMQGFWMSRYEVSQRLYRRIMKRNPSTFRKSGSFPVETVSWHQAVKFTKRFSQRYKVAVRLPYEKEWEYACRAGSKKLYYWGNHINKRYAWYNMTSNDDIHKIRSKRPNRWGLYNMSGNVAEWCLDWYSDSPENGMGPDSGIGKVVRGGSWADDAYWLRSAFRTSSDPKTRAFTIGFRLVMQVK